MDNLKVLITKASEGYELLDSGNGEKLERFGEYVLRRPDPQVLWTKRLEEKEWKKADATFVNSSNNNADNAKWRAKDGVPKEWVIDLENLRFLIKPTAFKHTGIFPEHVPNWRWIVEQIKKANRPIKVLNLFGYTGGATLSAAQAGAEITHVDSSKSAITWARQNAEISSLSNQKIRWIEEDARKFVQRELRRGNKYDAIIMDPPAFGHGANNELWKIEDDFLNLLDSCFQILSSEPLFVLVNGYSAGYSALAYENSLLPLKDRFGGDTESGELAITESSSNRLLPAGIFARWFK